METFVKAYDTKQKKIILPPDASFSRSVSPEQIFSDERQASFLQIYTLVFTFCVSMRVSSTVAESLGNLNQLICVPSTYPGANVDPSVRAEHVKIVLSPDVQGSHSHVSIPGSEKRSKGPTLYQCVRR